MLAYAAVREMNLNSKEFHFISIVDSYSKESHIKLKDYAQMMKCSVRTVKRIIKSLKDKGYIILRYGLYKSLHIAVNALAGLLWKPNVNKSKGPKWYSKRAKHDPSNIERNKEINKGIKYPIFRPENQEISFEMPKEAQSMLENLKSKLGL